MKSPRRILQSLSFFLFLLHFASPAHAMVEIRGLVGVQTVSPSEFNSTWSVSQDALKFNSLMGFGADLIVNPPAFPIGFGARYTTSSQKVSADILGQAFEYKLQADRVALLINKRFIDTGVFFGPIATFGLSNTLKFSTVIAGTAGDYTGDDMLSYSVGLEGGFKLATFRLGAEVGYESFVAKKLKNSAGGTVPDSSGNDLKTDLSGIYARAIIGVGF